MLAALMLSVTGCAQTEAANEPAASSAETAAQTESLESVPESSSIETETEETDSLESFSSASPTDLVGTGEAFTASEDNTHALSADGETLSYDNISVTKTGGGEGDKADFYGTNAAIFAENGAELSITNSYVNTAGSHANAVFSYGEGTVINISDSVIETSENTSGGIMVTGGGSLNAEDLSVTTQGGSSAAIRSDRGGGTMNVNGGTYKSYGSGSPAIYSTADVTVSNAELYSDISQAVVVEGKNSVTLNNTNAVGKNTNKNSDKSDYYQAVMIYQSMSGDAAEGKGSFTMNGGSLTSLNGGMFFVTNTVAEINLDNVELNYDSDDLLRICSAGWGNTGVNGGQVTVNAKDQSLKGIITVDDVSNLNLLLSGSSSFEGSIDNTGEVYVELHDQAVWKLTADSSITSLSCSAEAIDLNGFTLTVNGQEYAEGTASEGTAIEVKITEHSAHGGDGPENGSSAHGPGGSGEKKPDQRPGQGPDDPGQKSGQDDPGHGPGKNMPEHAFSGQDGHPAPPDADKNDKSSLLEQS